MAGDKLLRYALTVWGWLCLIWSGLYVILSAYAAGDPAARFYPGTTGLGVWIGMGLISLGLARLLDNTRK